jgi:hypothetical protein
MTLVPPADLLLVAAQRAEATPAWEGAVPVAVSVLVAVVVLISVPCLTVALIVWLTSDGPDGGPGQDLGGGPGGDRPPDAPGPPGPICWPDFEREFAEYVATVSTRATEVGRRPDRCSRFAISPATGPSRPRRFPADDT